MNMMAVRTNATTVLIDAGIGFPALQHYGINVRIPDLDAIRAEFGSFDALLLTHGHEDHIGATPFICTLLDGPIYGTRLTLTLVERRLNDHGIDTGGRLIPVTTDSSLTLGDLEIEFVPVTHSIPDSTAIVVRSPVGTLVHTGDFKFDQCPLTESEASISRLKEIGRDGVLAAYSDSTNASNRGQTGTELDVRRSLEHLCESAPARVFVTTFASSIHRIQLLIDVAHKTGRNVGFLGRGIERNVNIAEHLGYIRIPPGTRQPLATLRDRQAKNVLCILSGSQGEPLAALARVAANEHKTIAIEPDDTVIFSARTIPGNELATNQLKDNLARLGARIFDNDLELVHVSGHGSQDDLVKMMSLLNPKYLVPIHGNFRELKQHAALAEINGVIPLLANNGDRVCFDKSKAWLGNPIPVRDSYLDNDLSIVVKEHVITERRRMAKNGVLVVVCRIDPNTRRIEEPPKLITRGTSTDNSNSDHGDDLTEAIHVLLNSALADETNEPEELLETIMPNLTELARVHFGSAPMILPVVLEN